MNKLQMIAEPGKHDFTITRIFDAPPELVFKVITNPELVPQWWGPEEYKTVVEQMDVRFGGTWRYVQNDNEGNVHPFRGVFHEVQAPRRLVYTLEYENQPGHIALETVELEPYEGGTKLSFQDVFQSVADRDGWYEAGAVEGGKVTMDRLEALLEKVRA
ncbi:MAG TPA: SRPBCC domain-containing protein [Anaerolineaceae bacterium]|nr:SRPBCC domain-containing protein [Anaerolineaceae bacterium]